MENEKRMAGSYEIIQAFHFGPREIVIGEDKNAAPGEHYMCAYHVQNGILSAYEEIELGDDYGRIVVTFGDRLLDAASGILALQGCYLYCADCGRRMTLQTHYTLTYKVGLGMDVFGNIQRMDNLLESMPTRQLDYKEKLKNLEIQVENAKQEIAKPLPREEELKEKSARLDQLNILLNMDKRENEIVDGVPEEGEIQPQRESRGWER